MKRLRIFSQQLIRQIRHLFLRLRRLCRMCNSQCQHHLTLPERNRIYNHSLNFLHHTGIIILDQTDLRCRLHGNRTRQLQIMQLLFKTVALLIQILRNLRILRKPTHRRLILQFQQLPVPRLLQLLLTSQNIHRQFLKIIQILLIHLIQHRRILHQPNLMLFQSIRDLFHIHFRFGILILHILNLRRLLLKKAKKSPVLFHIKILQLSDNTRNQIPHLAQILRLHILQRSIGKIRHLLLCPCSILQNLIRILNVNLRSKILHHLLLRRCQHRLLRLRLHLNLRF